MTAVPDSPGVYCFFVGHPHASVPPAGYPLYVGSTGLSKKQNAVRRTLRDRFGDYLKEKDDPKGRLNIRLFLRTFAGEVTFLCSPGTLPADQMLELEKQLNDALMPPYSIRDFSGQIRRQRNAWQ
jgi:hypothetical protein